MSEPVSPQQPELKPELQSLSREAAAAALPAVRSAARWFWWIAGLSLVNVFMSASGTSFVAGLGLLSLIDAMFQSSPSTGYAIDAAILGFFVLLGQQGLKGKLWAFYAGVAIYLLDTLIFLMVQDWISVAFHAFVLFFLVRGALVLQNALKGQA